MKRACRGNAFGPDEMWCWNWNTTWTDRDDNSAYWKTKKSLSFSLCVGVRASLSRLRGCQSHFHWCTGASCLTEQASVGGTICRRSAGFLYFLSAEMRAEQKFCALLNPAAASPAARGVDIRRETRAFQRQLSEQQALGTANPPIHIQ